MIGSLSSGPVAQLVARFVRNEEVRGSNPLRSTGKAPAQRGPSSFRRLTRCMHVATMSNSALERPVDAFVSVGSAGLPPQIDQANDLHAEQVFAGQATDTVSWLPGSGDAWAWVGQASPLHPVDPTGSGFGAEVFDVNGGDGRAGARDHGALTNDGSGYFDRDTQSLRNIALATTGQGELVSRESTPAPPLLPIGTR